MSTTRLSELADSLDVLSQLVHNDKHCMFDNRLVAAKMSEAAAHIRESERGWIPVSERLPKRGCVLAVSAEGEIDLYQWNLVGDYANDTDPRACITHWMPPPLAPKQAKGACGSKRMRRE